MPEIFNLANDTYRTYKRTNNSLLYINASPNHSLQVIKQLLTPFNERLSKNSSSEEIFINGYLQTELIFDKQEQRKQKRNHSENVIWFNPPFSGNFTNSIPKRFLNDFLDILFRR